MILGLDVTDTIDRGMSNPFQRQTQLFLRTKYIILCVVSESVVCVLDMGKEPKAAGLFEDFLNGSVEVGELPLLWCDRSKLLERKDPRWFTAYWILLGSLLFI